MELAIQRENSNPKKSEKNYVRVSKDGDTLEISEQSKEPTAVKYTDATLAKFPKSKLQQLLAAGKITKKQYEKASRKI